MIKLTIDGRPLEVEPGTNVLEAAARLGIEIPHYCYHPDIGADGNCRMCLVQIGDATRKLPIACMLPCTEGMAVQTASPAVVKARKGVLEFLLINHPLDCTICDQAGECPLQDYSYRFGPGDSRFAEAKGKKQKHVPFSEQVLFDGERCILCTRCVRFFTELRGSKPIGVVNMGGKTTLSLGPGGPIDDPYQMNIIDVCPVGALTSRDFRFKQRVWFMDFAETVCPGCARGCNVTAGAYQNKLLRFTPRRNPEVNKSWMCDEGRLSYKAYNLAARTRGAVVRGQPSTVAVALEALAGLVGDGSRAAVLASTALTCEELFALKSWAGKAGIRHLWHGAASWAGDEFLKLPDATPNTAGARELGFALAPLLAGSPTPRPAGLSVLVVAGEVAVPPALLDGLDALALQAPSGGPLAEGASVLLPGRTPLETKGTWVNATGQRQAVRPALDPGEGVPENWTLWRDL
ncbi:MAG TPA: 2Fe-2S iron-sulfur cluster-binding protein, partial [Planctomycetota bacterium]|nr:2Fe-2S iron-sulfur cluster-binding protein [Planctomycetota bacterium]